MSPYTPLLRPRHYFETREVNFFRVMAVVGVLLFAGPLTVYGIGWVMTDHIDGTVVVDNPERPPESYCANVGCEDPKEIERNVDAVIRDAMNEFAGPAFLVYPLLLGFVALLLHGGVWVIGGEQGWFPTFAVAAWGLVPTVALVAISVTALSTMVDPVTVTPGDDVSTALAPLEAQFRAFDPYRTVGAAVSALWGGLIWRAGLLEHQGLRNAEATILAGIVSALYMAAGALL